MEEQQTLSNLPDVILLKIFGELSSDKEEDLKVKDLLNATLVCKKWNDLISNSPKTLEKLKLSFDAMRYHLRGQCLVNSGIFKINRKYRKLSFGGIDKNVIAHKDCKFEVTHEIYENIVLSCGNNLICLEMDNLDLRLVDLVKLLSCCQVIEKLSLFEVDLDKTGSENQEAVELKQLKDLSLTDQDGTDSVKILDFIECTNLEKFDISFDEFDDEYSLEKESHTDIIVKFLNLSDTLDKLAITCLVWRSKILLQPKFRLNELHFCSIKLPPPSSTEFTTTIASLEALGGVTKEKAKVYLVELDYKTSITELILNNCVNIEDLSFYHTHFPSDVSQLRQMKEVQKLKLDDLLGFDHHEFDEEDDIDLQLDLQRRNFIALMEKMPNVKHLDLESSACILETEIAPILFANVTSLDSSIGVLEDIQAYSFPNLTTLTVTVPNDERKNALKHLAAFCSVNLNLIHLEVKITLESTVEAQFMMLQLYPRLCLHNSMKNFTLTDRSRRRRVKLHETKDSIEMKQFGKVLSEEERMSLNENFLFD